MRCRASARPALAFGHGTTNAYDEAAYLLLHALHLPLDRLDPFLDARLTQAERAQVAQVLDRRIDRRVPAAYLTQEAWLGEFRFYVDERVIIPRSYIAELLPDGLAPYVGAPELVASALDLGTGSGCLAILLAHAYPAVDVDASDVSTDALTVAQRNVADYGLADRINLIRSDLFSNLSGKELRPHHQQSAVRHERRDGQPAARIPARAARRARRRRRRPRCGAHDPRGGGAIPESRRHARGRGRPQPRLRSSWHSQGCRSSGWRRRCRRTACSC